MYSFQSRIKFSEINRDKLCDIGAIINYFQDCSTFHSESLGVGMDYLHNRNRAWFLNAWQVELFRRPSLCENVTIGTWPYDFNKLYGYRNYVMWDENNEPLASANAIWFLADTTNLKPTKITEEDLRHYQLEEKFEMTYLSRKILYPEDLSVVDTFKVIPAFIDTNNHVNNAWYIKIALGYLPNDFVVSGIRAEYRTAATLNDTMIVKVCQSKDYFYVLLLNKEHKPYTIIEFRKD